MPKLLLRLYQVHYGLHCGLHLIIYFARGDRLRGWGYLRVVSGVQWHASSGSKRIVPDGGRQICNYCLIPITVRDRAVEQDGVN